MSNDNIYIHYGMNRYYKDNLILSLRTDRNNGLNKPVGLWGSPINTEFGWKEFCEESNFHTDKLKRSFKFKVTDNTKILHVYESDDIIKYIIKKKAILSLDTYIIDIDKIKDEGYDGIELHLSNSRDYMILYNDFMYGWDCDSIVVWNPYSIIQL